MMMARDFTPQRPELDAASVDTLARALAKYLEDDEGADLLLVLRHIAEEARSRHMHAEQLLVALKDVWYSLPAIRNSPEGEQQNRILQRVITLCIRQYYAG
ncbi:MAG TPA: hypothetical protein VKH19_19745 [Gemmatimonadaceae bacterium]|nr:hypothetical protein [Gemmatimonadaceae bacterium]